MSVLVTGGTGKTGRRLVEQLRRQGVKARIAARHPPEGAAFDWAVRETWDGVLNGVSAVYLVAPPSGDPAVMIDFIRLAASRRARRFVLLSASLNPAGGPGPGQVHAWLRDNAAEWAVLRPSWFMENFSEGPHRATIVEEARIYSAAGDGRVPFISAEDIAKAACAALTAPVAPNTDFILTGPVALSYGEAAAAISSAINREVTHAPISIEALAARLLELGLPPATARILAAMDGMIAGGAEDRTTPDVEALTGAPAVPFEQFCQLNAGIWASQTPSA